MVKRAGLCLLFAVSLAGCTSKFHAAVQAYLGATSLAIAHHQTWYELALSGLWFMSIAGAVAAYGLRKLIERGKFGVKEKRRWRERRELRWVIYAYAIQNILQLPIAALKAFRISRTVVSPFAPPPSFWSEFQADTLIYVAVGVAAIIYDQRRLRRQLREERQADRRCIECGYDLRATPDQCPECGVPALPRTEPTPYS